MTAGRFLAPYDGVTAGAAHRLAGKLMHARMSAMVVNQTLIRALFLLVVAMVFGIGSLRYSAGSFAKPGPGLFPLGVSCILFGMGLISLLQSRILAAVPMNFAIRGFGIILVSFFGFAVISSFVNMIAGIVFMVFFAALVSSPYSWMRNLKIAGGLIVIALLMQQALGLDLPLY